MTGKPPRCIVRSPLSTRDLHQEYVKSLTDEQLRGDDALCTIHERPVNTATHRKSEPAPENLTGFAPQPWWNQMTAVIIDADGDVLP